MAAWRAAAAHARQVCFIPYVKNFHNAQHLELWHRLQRAEQLVQRDAFAGREVRDAGEEPARRADASDGFEFEVAKLRGLSAKQGDWEVDCQWVDSGKHHPEVESLEWGRTAEAVEDAEDVGAVAGKAEGAYPGCQEQLRGSERSEPVLEARADADVNTHEERGGALHHGLEPRDGEARGDG